MTIIFRMSLLLMLVLTAACENEVDSAPLPQALTDNAVGAYCGMILTEHAGPKGQIFEKGRKDPVWFTAVRDAIAYTRLPGEGQNAVAFYVHDMSRAESWESPQRTGIWISADTAFYVVGSNKRGGMGMFETVPFGTQEAAEAFASKYGGRVLRLADIPLSALLPDDAGIGATIADQYSGKEVFK
jgi:copper chaperone NosL